MRSYLISPPPQNLVLVLFLFETRVWLSSLGGIAQADVKLEFSYLSLPGCVTQAP